MKGGTTTAILPAQNFSTDFIGSMDLPMALA
jgi:hypothetical protein